MKKPILYTASAVLLFFVFLVLKIPANQVVPRISLPPDIAIRGVNGTLWDGHAEQVVVKGLAINNVKWQLDILPLLLGKAAVDLDAGSARNPEQISIEGQFVISRATIQASNATLFAPTPLLMAQVELPIPVDASGRARVNINELHFAHATGCKKLAGNGSWLNAAVAGLNGPVQLGSFEATLACDNGPINITTAADNSLNLDATAVIQHNGRFSVQGRFKVSPDLPKEVHQAARFFGSADAQGFYNIKL